MKNRLWALLFIFFGLINSCSKDSNDSVDQNKIDYSANYKTSGASANDILSNNTFDKLKIEIAYVTGYKPTTNAMTDFIAFLKKYSFKEDIELIYTELDSPNEEKLTLEEIDDLEKENRTIYNDGSTLGIYIYFTDAPSEDDIEDEDLVTLGAVYWNTSMVIYEETIRTLANKSFAVDIDDVETATLNHEFGHLMGLVNIGSTPVNDHEGTTTDDDGNEIGDNHCTEEGCLMRAELQFGTSMGKFLQNRAAKGLVSIPELGDECVLDLQANGGR
ncbi:hypothetical protein R3X28_15710 [Maribacter sp. TH_r10]|uniref:Membrane metalloprotease n=1 Tax=Maribacter luteus TaxID=2594478 RepID=A0A6I2MH49_9FLAO|nr:MULTISPECIES: hypothetical protein [Maribacter]MDV7140338.1 hypothetical protein [Maribacter sp. TH_r10]MRX63191.1 hypothetical protein [Maribacter luteus]|tara:strand:+ start:1514 stop:2335 length:822 start_codon:yes stop_codon:yes gene_type:complete